MVIEEDIRQGKMAELKWIHTIPPIFTHLAWHKDKWMTTPLQGFIDLTLNMSRQHSSQI
ncbi:hypothetical protein [Metabacillus sp. RGM 3146]|uniref:hypothetical protein n=1 Tax=Metabacillus sp. RGM 3146 TaxID=3401092 RepID=UPI003B9A88A0